RGAAALRQRRDADLGLDRQARADRRAGGLGARRGGQGQRAPLRLPSAVPRLERGGLPARLPCAALRRAAGGAAMKARALLAAALLALAARRSDPPGPQGVAPPANKGPPP